MKKKAVGYIRVSEKDPKRKGDLKEKQLDYIRKYCKQNEYELVDVYQEFGHASSSDRPVFQKLFDDIEGIKDNFDIVVVYSLDRFTRNIKDLLIYLNIMEKHNVEFEIATMNVKNLISKGVN